MVYTLLDAQKADLPNFVASNALRLPAFKIEDADACHLAVSMKTLSDQVSDLKSAFNEVNAKVSSLLSFVHDQHFLLPATSKASQPLLLTVLATTAAASNTGQPSWASLVSQPAPAGAYQPVRRKVVGSSCSTSSWRRRIRRTGSGTYLLVVSIKTQLKLLLLSISR